jgi:hypothetical protein
MKKVSLSKGQSLNPGSMAGLSPAEQRGEQLRYEQVEQGEHTRVRPHRVDWRPTAAATMILT